MVGVCLDALNPAGAPSVAELRASGADGARLVAFADQQFFDYFVELQAAGLRTAVVLARESFGDDNAYEAARWYAERIRPTYWVLGNEPDAGLLPVPSPSSWSMPVAVYFRFWQLAAAGVLSVQPDAKLIIGGLVSGQVRYLAELLPLDPEPYGVDVHCYAKGPEEARELLQAYKIVLQDYET